MRKRGLVKNDCADIGFAQALHIAGAISFEEFRNWLYKIIGEEESVPNYVFDLLDQPTRIDLLDNQLRIMGFVPHTDHTVDEDRAVDGIAYLRNSDYVSDWVTRETAVAALKRNPHIREKAEAEFDISIPAEDA